MIDLSEIGKTIVVVGGLLVLVGLLLMLAARLGLGRLPGDILVRRGNMSCQLLLGTSLLLSLLLTLVLNVVSRLLGR